MGKDRITQVQSLLNSATIILNAELSDYKLPSTAPAPTPSVPSSAKILTAPISVIGVPPPQGYRYMFRSELVDADYLTQNYWYWSEPYAGSSAIVKSRWVVNPRTKEMTVFSEDKTAYCCYTNLPVPPDIPTNFSDTAEGYRLDSTTGLKWFQNPDSKAKTDWAAAKKLAASSKARLPTAKEIERITDTYRIYPSLYPDHGFAVQNGVYWLYDEAVDNTGMALTWSAVTGAIQPQSKVQVCGVWFVK